MREKEKRKSQLRSKSQGCEASDLPTPEGLLAVTARENGGTLKGNNKFERHSSGVTRGKGARVIGRSSGSILRIKTRQIKHNALSTSIVRKRVFGRSDEHVNVGNLKCINRHESRNRRIHDNALALDGRGRLLRERTHIDSDAERERTRGTERE